MTTFTHARPAHHIDLALEHNPGLVDLLLVDRSTKGRIKWATDNYVELHGAEYGADQEIHPHSQHIIVPRWKKDKDTQKARTKGKAEVFTPSWIVDKMVTDVITNLNGLDFDAFLEATWLEITCGEAPYMVNRYDIATGEIIPLEERVGFIDRKFQRLNTEASSMSPIQWFIHARTIYEASYGYEYQGDSLFIARMNLLNTFIDNYRFVFGTPPSNHELCAIAEIISWNVFQMDGLKNTVPYSDNVYAVTMDWRKQEVTQFME